MHVKVHLNKKIYFYDDDCCYYTSTIIVVIVILLHYYSNNNNNTVAFAITTCKEKRRTLKLYLKQFNHCTSVRFNHHFLQQGSSRGSLHHTTAIIFIIIILPSSLLPYRVKGLQIFYPKPGRDVDSCLSQGCQCEVTANCSCQNLNFVH